MVKMDVNFVAVKDATEQMWAEVLKKDLALPIQVILSQTETREIGHAGLETIRRLVF